MRTKEECEKMKKYFLVMSYVSIKNNNIEVEHTCNGALSVIEWFLGEKEGPPKYEKIASLYDTALSDKTTGT